MLFEQVDKKNIVDIVKKEIQKASKSLYATMLLKEELKNPLPKSYHLLLKEKLKEELVLKRLGFGTKKESSLISEIYAIESKNYCFHFTPQIMHYQRLLIIDNRVVFFKLNNIFLRSSNNLIIKAFSDYFLEEFSDSKEVQ